MENPKNGCGDCFGFVDCCGFLTSSFRLMEFQVVNGASYREDAHIQSAKLL